MSLKDLGKKGKSIKNKYLENREEGLRLITRLISAEDGIDEKRTAILREIELNIERGFLDLVTKYQCPFSAKIYSSLQKAYEDIVDVVNFPKLENALTVAVGGAFSAGKSRFLNAVLKDETLLPTDTSPTTSIPTYILSGEKDSIFALNRYQHRVEIDQEALHAVSHAFKNEYGVSFSHILKLITVERKVFPYKNILFLDTPGYSKSDRAEGRHDNTDENIAREHLRTADYLIWLIDIQNGTIPQNDINFIKSLDFETELLVVLNKADSKIETEIENIINVTKTGLKNNDIEFYDVVAFSSSEKKEYSPSGNVLNSFLDRADRITPGTELVERVNNIFEEFLSYQKTEIENLRQSRKVMNEGSVDMKIDDKYRQTIEEVSRRQKEDIIRLIGSEKEGELLQSIIIGNVKKLFSEIKITISDNSSPRKKKKEPPCEKKTYRFEAAFECKNQKELSRIKDLKSINGAVEKVSGVGVVINAEADSQAVISHKEVKHRSGLDAEKLFQKGDRVVIQYVEKNKCVVII